jgi:hypothetical protein
MKEKSMKKRIKSPRYRIGSNRNDTIDLSQFDKIVVISVIRELKIAFKKIEICSRLFMPMPGQRNGALMHEIIGTDSETLYNDISMEKYQLLNDVVLYSIQEHIREGDLAELAKKYENDKSFVDEPENRKVHSKYYNYIINSILVCCIVTLFLSILSVYFKH